MTLSFDSVFLPGAAVSSAKSMCAPPDKPAHITDRHSIDQNKTLTADCCLNDSTNNMEYEEQGITDYHVVKSNS